jgi:hypothetical protein
LVFFRVKCLDIEPESIHLKMSPAKTLRHKD